MKIEKVNDLQIRCTLTSEDLANRHIKLSELAYGSEKAKLLFRDMMKQARSQVGFNADNIPLMIEAIPVSPDSIMLVITKVNNPEELDTRFARFAPASTKQKGAAPALEGADSILNVLRKLCGADTEVSSEENKDAKGLSYKVDLDFIRLYKFSDLDKVIEAASSLEGKYDGINTLYKTNEEYPYILVIHKSLHSAEDFNKVCNVICEYGVGDHCSTTRETHLKEHAKILVDKNALQQLSTIK